MVDRGRYQRDLTRHKAYYNEGGSIIQHSTHWSSLGSMNLLVLRYITHGTYLLTNSGNQQGYLLSPGVQLVSICEGYERDKRNRPTCLKIPALVLCRQIFLSLWDAKMAVDVSFLDVVLRPVRQPFDIRPLSFDRVHGGYTTTSPFPIFFMPVELFPHVLDYLSRSDLQALALVDRDCHRLSTLYNFKDVRMHFEPETYNRYVATQSFSLSPECKLYAPRSCVRRLTITNISRFYRIIPLMAEFRGLKDDAQRMLQHFVDSVANFVQYSFPNLHILDWDSTIPMSSNLMLSIFSSPIRHLQLKDAILAQNVILSSNRAPPLETFSVQFSSFAPSRELLQLVGCIICSAASTLRQLTWHGYLEDIELPLTKRRLPFPNLRSLSLDMVSSNCDDLLSMFLGDTTRVETLALDSMTPSTWRFFRTRGYVSSLAQFCWLNRDVPTSTFDDVICFLENNPQLRALRIPNPVHPYLLNDVLLPMIHNNFDALASLHVVWDASDLYDGSLQAVARIDTLRHLWISVGDQNSTRNAWEVNHSAILIHLSPLVHLQSIAFSKDTYRTDIHPLAPRSWDYYSTKGLPVDVDITDYLSPVQVALYRAQDVDYAEGVAQQIEMRHMAWEHWHAEAMLNVAREYARTFPALRWMFVGQLPIGFSPSGQPSLMNEPPRREPCLDSLQKKMSMTMWRPT